MNNIKTNNVFFKGVKISGINPEIFIGYIEMMLKSNESSYVCFNDVCNIVSAYKYNPELKKAINSSNLSLPDGKPLTIYGKLLGCNSIGRITGYNAMKLLFEYSNGKNISHCFIGDTTNMHNALRAKITEGYNNLIIKGMYSPPFGNWDSEKDKLILDKINEFDADIIWISFGGVRQEIWMYNNIHKIKKGIVMGVGAGFKWFTGTLKTAPKILQNFSLEWIYRILQDPVTMKKSFRYYPTFIKDYFFEVYRNRKSINKQPKK